MNMTPLNGSNKIVVVGGGAAGMMAAGMAAQAGAHVTLLEQNGRPGKKLLITSTIDNRLKGAVGQAVQNMNIMFGINETTGLNLKSSAF